MGFWKTVADRVRNIFTRGYDAVDDRRFNRNWNAVNQPMEFIGRASRDDLRAKARDLEMNSDLTNALIMARERNLIGAGYTLQARTPSARLNTEIEKLWMQWTKARNCDVTGVQSLHAMLRMAVRRKLVDGGVFIHKCFTPKGKVRLQLQMLEVDSLDLTHNFPKDSHGITCVNGVEYDPYNRPVAYWFTQFEPDGLTSLDSVRVDANDIIFYFDRTRPTQLREISGLAPMMTRIRDTNQFVEAVAVKQRIEACLAVFIKRVKADQTAARNVTRRKGGVDYEGLELGPGLIQDLNAGDEIQVVNPTGQATDAAEFVRMFQRMIGAAYGLSYESVTRDNSSANYSSARQGAIEDELTYATEREQLEAILDEIYETFVISCWLSELIPIDNLFADKEKYFAHEWVRRPKPWIDPLKEANANKIALQSGIKTFPEICAERGQDWRDVVDTYAEIAKYGEKKGIDLSQLLFDGRQVFMKDEPEPQQTMPKPQQIIPEQKEVDGNANDAEGSAADGSPPGGSTSGDNAADTGK